jgi:hypothetical protein
MGSSMRTFAEEQRRPDLPSLASPLPARRPLPSLAGEEVGSEGTPMGVSARSGPGFEFARVRVHSGAAPGGAAPAGTLGPVLARFDVAGAERQRERSEAIQHGLDPDDPRSKPAPDDLREKAREAARNPPPRPPEPIIPGDPTQQHRTLAQVDGIELWRLPRIQSQMQTIAAQTEARERATVGPSGTVKHTAEAMLDYWRIHFAESVEYILYTRGGGRHAPLLKQLRAEEAKLVKAAPADLVDQVKALRERFAEKWRQEVDRAADRFVIVAENEGKYLTIHQAADPVSIYGLPKDLEPEVEASAAPDQINKGSKPVAESVVTFMKAVQKESGLKKALADNYTDHEKHSPYLGNIENVGKYSFDVDLGGLIKVNAEGFYEREPLIKFFLAVDRAATATGIAWIALYNDFEVIKTVNERLGKHRLGFAGGYSAGPGQEGSIHHGPAPYILHIHFNIMPIATAGQYVAGNPIPPPHIDLGQGN